LFSREKEIITIFLLLLAQAWAHGLQIWYARFTVVFIQIYHRTCKDETASVSIKKASARYFFVDPHPPPWVNIDVKDRFFQPLTNKPTGGVMAEPIRAPVAGKVISVLVSPGDTVEENEEIMVLEAMKMESSVYAVAGGTIAEIKIQPGDNVDEDDVLMTLE
jgi:biotin carboxyl carrier protein